MKLYFAPQTRSITALWMLLEAGAPYEIVRVNIRAPGHPSAEYRQVNPMGKVPALQDGGLGFGETSAVRVVDLPGPPAAWQASFGG